jgi:hypothetical protein
MNPLAVIGLAATAAALLFSKDKEAKMPAVQKQFEDFNSAICLDDEADKAKLRDKRETLLRALNAGLDTDVSAFTPFNQGSYAMHTGVIPLDLNYDIDVGLVFDCKKDKYPDPVALKKKVHKALSTHGRTVRIRRPCVTVNYMKGETVDYHVDLAIYVKRDDGLYDLAKGRENSAAEHRIWEVADPNGLKERICGAFSDAAQMAQYRRCIRYLKRWRHFQFQSGGAPVSIALTVAALYWFKPSFAASGKPTDLVAMYNWVQAILNQFESHWNLDDGFFSRLKVTSPVTPGGDLMAKMTNGQMETFKAKLEALRDALKKAYDEELPEVACEVLQKQFGDDFKVPEKSETAKAVASAVISTGNSA